VSGPGVRQVLFRDLPAGLSVEDVRVSARGPKGSRLGDLTVGSEVRKVTETPEYRALKAEGLEIWNFPTEFRPCPREGEQ
jgi:hypothetical protein